MSESWIEAGDLQEGDSIVSLGGVYGTVEKVIVVDAIQTMYDLTVEEVHTFAVGDGDWVVHNCIELPQSTFIHIIDGVVDNNGYAVGYHHRQGRNGNIVSVIQQPDTNGVYTAAVDVWDAPSGSWVPKTAPGGGGQRQENSMFPDSWSIQDVRDNITSAMNGNPSHVRTTTQTVVPRLPDGSRMTDPVTGQRVHQQVTTDVWRGRSHGGVLIEWLYRNGQLITAYPIYGG